MGFLNSSTNKKEKMSVNPNLNFNQNSGMLQSPNLKPKLNPLPKNEGVLNSPPVHLAPPPKPRKHVEGKSTISPNNPFSNNLSQNGSFSTNQQSQFNQGISQTNQSFQGSKQNNFLNQFNSQSQSVKERLPDLKLKAQNKPIKNIPLELPKLKKKFEIKSIEEIPSFKTLKQIPAFDVVAQDSETEYLPPVDMGSVPINLDWRHKGIKGPLYVRTDKYTQVINTIDNISTYVKESSEIIYSLENLKKNMDLENIQYKKTLEDMQRKIIYVDKILFDRV